MTDDRIIAVIEAESKRKGYTPYTLSDKCGFAHTTVFKWFQLYTSPRLSMVCTVLDALGLELVVRRKRNAADNV